MHFCIVGTSRSGSTLLRSLLHASHSIALFNETQWLPILHARFGSKKAGFQTLLEMALTVTWDDSQNLIDYNISNHAVDPAKAYARLEIAKKDNNSYTVAEFHEQIKSIIFADKPHNIWGDKTPDYGPYMTTVQSLWPDCKFIHITRNATDCAYSMQRHRGCRILMHAQKTSWVDIAQNKAFLEYDDSMLPLERCLDSWHEKMCAIRTESKDLRLNSYLEVDYQDLITEPERTLTEIFRFLGHPYIKTTAITKAIKEIHSNSIKNRSAIDTLGFLSLKQLTVSTPAKDQINHPSKKADEDANAINRDMYLIGLIKSINTSAKTNDSQRFLMNSCHLIYHLIKVAPSAAEHWFQEILSHFVDHNHLLEYLLPLLTNTYDLTPAENNDFATLQQIINQLQQKQIHNWGILFAGLLRNSHPRPFFHQRLLQLLLQAQAYDALSFFAETAQKAYPENTNFLRPLINGYFNQQQTPAAEALITKGQFSPDKPEDILLFYRLSMAKEAYGDALAYAKQLIRHNDAPLHHHQKLARALDLTGDPEAAEEHLLQACKRFSSPLPLLNALAQLYHSHQLWKKMVPICEQIIAIDPNPQQYRRAILALRHLGYFDKALMLCEELPKEEQMLERAHLLFKQRNIKAAETAYQSAATTPQGLFALAQFYLDTDQPHQAAGILKNAPQHKPFALRYAQLNALITHKQKGTDHGIRCLDLSLATFPEALQLRLMKIQLLNQKFSQDESLKKELEDLAAGKPDIIIQKRLAHIYLRDNDIDKALSIIDGLTTFSLDLLSTILRCWALCQHQSVTAAQQQWHRYTENNYINEIHEQPSALELITKGSQISPTATVLFTVLRNECLLLSHFFEHYRALGVGHFIVVDNNSNDGSTEWLQQQPDITLYHTAESYKSASYGIQWINTLKRKHAANQWCLYADIDEFLVLPSPAKNLQHLTSYLDDKGYEAVRGFMLDMYSETLEQAKLHSSDIHPLNTAPYFDNHFESYPAVNPPFVETYGGFRQRFFWHANERGNPLVKTPLVKGDKVHFLSSSHTISPAKIADLTTVFLHVKFLGDCENRFDEEISRQEHACVTEEYQRYRDVLLNTPNTQSLLCEKSVHFESADQLERLGLIERGKLI